MVTTSTLHNDAPRNPFTPVFGKIPLYMAGREMIIETMLSVLDEPENNPDRCTLLLGVRGMGKTALLSYIAREAHARGWISADVTATPGMLEDILQRIRRQGAHLLTEPNQTRISSIGVSAVGSIAWEKNSTDTPNWRSRMDTAFEQLAATDTGLLITVDEIDPTLDELEQLVVTFQHFVREGKKVALFMAGLPHKITKLVSGESTSFLRRAARYALGPIPAYEVSEAFRLTIESAGKCIDDEALDHAVHAIGGFPYMFQLVGYRMWNAAMRTDSIGIKELDRGIRLAREELRARVFDATFAELTPADIAFLRAMAQDEGDSKRSDIKTRLGKSSSHVSIYKKRLMDDGVIEEPRPETLRFALPGFRDYVLDVAGE